MRRDFLQDGFGQAVPQVPAVAGLHRAGQRAADRFAVGAGAVAAHGLDAGMTAQPFPSGVRGAAGQNVGLGVESTVA